MPDGTCRTLKSQYHRNSAINFARGELRRNRSFKMQKNKLIVLGIINAEEFEQDNRTYSGGYSSYLQSAKPQNKCNKKI